MADLFPGFDAQEVDGENERLFCRIGGEGPPVVLLHGYPQCHAMWHRIAPRLAERFTVVVPDLPGYGRSSIPPDAADHAPYSKRRMGAEVAAVMARLGHDHFALVGHDRGARVGYRLALDAPERVERLAVLDIVPTGTLWRTFSVRRAMTFYHWTMLAQKAPLPETLVGGDPSFYLRHTIGGWTKAKDLSAIHPDALAAYEAFFREPERIHATCEDYRASATIDRVDDEADMDAGRKIEPPVLVLWGDTGFAGQGSRQLDVWREWCREVTGAPVDSGHFIPEENPDGVMEHLLPFLLAGRP